MIIVKDGNVKVKVSTVSLVKVPDICKMNVGHKIIILKVNIVEDLPTVLYLQRLYLKRLYSACRGCMPAEVV